MDVDALLFDIGGTVFDWRAAIMDALEEIEVDVSGTFDREAFSATWRRQSLIEVEAIACEQAPFRPFDQVLHTSLEHSLHEFGMTDLPIAARASLLACWEKMPAWPGARDALARLHGKYFLAPHTILSLRVAAFSSRRAGITWDAILSCDSLRAMKPNEASYRRAIEAIGRAPDRICFIASHPGDLRAAQRHGMRTAYVVARLEDYGDDYRDTGFAAEFDLVADDFADLATRMEC